MINWLRRRTLVVQLVGAGVLIMIGVFASVYQYQSNVVRQAILDMARSHAAHTGPMAAAALSTTLAQGDFASLTAIVAESTAEDGIAHIVVKDSSGKVVAESGDRGSGQPLLVKQVPLNLSGQSLGMATLTFTDASISGVLGALATRRLIVMLITMALVCLALVVVTRWIVRPLRELGDAAAAVVSGDYQTPKVSAASIEVAQLQDHFTSMGRNIRSQFEAIKASEEMQKRYLSVAESKILETRAALTDAHEARQLAETANAAKSQFLSKVSHEIRTPLNGMLGMLELLKDSKLDGSQRELASIAYGSGESLLAIINDILDFSKVEGGQFAVDTAAYDLRNLLYSVGQLFSVAASRKGLLLQTDVQANVPQFVVGDVLRLRQVLSNLLGNAIKFTDKGQISLSAWYQSARAAPDAAGTDLSAGVASFNEIGELYVRVSDSGVGIESHALADIFSPFIQADNSATRRYGGTGLGLSIVKSLMEAMSGGVSVSSAPAKGSTFTIRLPLPLAENAQEDLIERKPMRAVDLTGMRVLLVEDNAINMTLAERIIGKFGCVTTTASNGQEAIHCIEHAQFDAVLMDCQMPVMDGLEASAAIRERERSLGLVRLPIIAVTANASGDDRQTCLDHGMDDCVPKPYAAMALNTALARYFRPTA